jgi:TolB-like protein
LPAIARFGGIGADYVPETVFTGKDLFIYGGYFMKNTKVFTAVLFAVVFTSTAVAKDNLAILPFTGGADEEGDAIAELFSYNKELSAAFTLIPRTSIARAIRNEQNFQMSAGMTDPETIAAIGHQLGAQYIVAGSIATLGDRNLLVISILKIDDLRQIAGDIQTYAKIEEIQGKLPDMARRIIEATRIDAAKLDKLDKLAVIPVELGGNVDSHAADALAQILSINLIKSGKYAVYPRTATLEQVQEEYDNQLNGDVADENVVDIGKGENPGFVLSVAARRLGSQNMFNASIISLESGAQSAGESMNYNSLSDGIMIMEDLARELAGMNIPTPAGLSLVQSLVWIRSNVVEGGSYTITLKNNESIAPQTLSYGGKTVSITFEGGSADRRISLSSNGSLFTVEKGITLTLGANVTLQGRSNNASLVRVNEGGTLVLKDGAKISGNTVSSSFEYSSATSYGVGVYVNGGTFTMSGGTISGNTASAYSFQYSATSYGVGVYVNGGMFTMSDGTISGNTASAKSNSLYSSASAKGGGVYVSGGAFTMNGGTISGNTISSSAYYSHSESAVGGGVFVNSNSNSNGTFTMNGGTISGNSAGTASSGTDGSGGGVRVDSDGTFTMNDGTISGNSAGSGGGVSGRLTMSGGTIYGNTASNQGGGVWGTLMMNDGTISGNSAGSGGGVSGTLTMSGGTISSNTAYNQGGGVYVSGTFIKQAGGVVYGSDASGSLKNTARSGDSYGHAVYGNKRRNSTAGPDITLDSNISGSAGGWE